METIEALRAEIARYIASRKEVKLLDAEKELERFSDDKESEKYQSAFAKKQSLLAQFEPENWLTDASRRAAQISFVTHPLKFTHPDAKGLSGRVVAADTANTPYVSTAGLRQPDVDVVGNAAALDVAGLLQLKTGQMALADYVLAGDAAPIAGFATSEQQLKDWMSGFAQAFQTKELSSHGFARQIYFPVADGYHLLSPLFSSALTHAIFDRVRHSRFSEEAVAARKARRELQFSEYPVVEFPALAVQSFGGTKPQNISKLNNQRAGKAFLLPSLPPRWKTQEAPPTGSPQAFWRLYERQVWRTLREFHAFLAAHQNRPSNIAIREQRAAFTETLIDHLIMLAAGIQNRADWAGWSQSSQLSEAECLWLDPYREDALFQQKRSAMDWADEIAAQFARWMNAKLREFKLDVGDTEYLHFKDELDTRLHRLKGDLL